MTRFRRSDASVWRSLNIATRLEDVDWLILSSMIDHVSLSCSLVIKFDEIEIDEHVTEVISCSEVCDDDVVLWDVSMKYFDFVEQELMYLNRIVKHGQQLFDWSKFFDRLFGKWDDQTADQAILRIFITHFILSVWERDFLSVCLVIFSSRAF